MPALPNLLDFTRQALEKFVVEELGEARFRAEQIWRWLWHDRVTDFAAMTNIAQSCRTVLAEKACIRLPKIIRTQESSDGTTKFLLELADGARIETVLLPSLDKEGKRRWSQCLSSQVGCPMACTFCATGKSGFERNMTVAEILGQVLVGREFLSDTRPDHPILRNLVFMGMGEPLLNCDALLSSLEILNDPKGLAFSPRRITVSTCGIQDGLKRLGQSGLAYLAVSLHAPNQTIRAQIMPKAAKFSLPDLLASLSAYPLKTREHITFEYLLLKDINDKPEQAKELARIVHSVQGKLNLIAYNPTGESTYTAPSEERVLAFEKALWKHNVTAILRASKGQDIDAACGQLRAREHNETKKER